MKDYYYFLGISRNASAEDIKKAYRKLSVKYHPDKNDNDRFFSDRFKEVNEAYETLINDERKVIYDKNLSHQKENTKSNLPPKIKNFSASKIRVAKDEEFTVYWNTYDADFVKIVPFGLEKTSGERTIRIKEFDSNGRFQILLHATNTLLHKTVVQSLIITEMPTSAADNEIEDSKITKTKEQNNRQKKETKSKILVSFIIFFALIAAIIYKLSS